MKKYELGGNITLTNFNLDNQEMIIAKKIIGNYAKKIKNTVEYTELKLEMKMHKKLNKKEFEIKSFLSCNGINFNSESRGFNPFIAIDESLKKINAEVEHKFKK